MRRDLPFSKCWWITDRLLAGPVFFAGRREEVLAKIDALKAIGITMIVSLVGIWQFYADEDEAEEIAWEIAPTFIWLGFDLPDGTAPDPETMQTMLGWIDAWLRGDGKVFVHCTSGCGRTATLIGCWLARHGIAEGDAVLDYLDELRIAAGLPVGCPETDAQRQLVTSWRKGRYRVLGALRSNFPMMNKFPYLWVLTEKEVGRPLFAVAIIGQENLRCVRLPPKILNLRREAEIKLIGAIARAHYRRSSGSIVLFDQIIGYTYARGPKENWRITKNGELISFKAKPIRKINYSLSLKNKVNRDISLLLRDNRSRGSP